MPGIRPKGLKYKIKKINPAWFKKGFNPWNTGTIGVVKSNSGSFKKGEHVSKKTEFVKGQNVWNKGIEYIKLRNEKHPKWKGNIVGYEALHTWIARKLGKPKTCEHCGKSGLTGRQIHWANKYHTYIRNLNDWIRLCSICHGKYDIKNKLRTHRIHGY